MDTCEEWSLQTDPIVPVSDGDRATLSYSGVMLEHVLSGSGATLIVYRFYLARRGMWQKALSASVVFEGARRDW